MLLSSLASMRLIEDWIVVSWSIVCLPPSGVATSRERAFELLYLTFAFLGVASFEYPDLRIGFGEAPPLKIPANDLFLGIPPSGLGGSDDCIGS